MTTGRRRLVLWATGGAALLAVLVSTLVVALGGEDVDSGEVWRAENADSNVDGDPDVALWAHEAVVTRVGPTDTGDVAGYDAADGGQLWRQPPPERARAPAPPAITPTLRALGPSSTSPARAVTARC